jgi:hypothetical protein
MENLMNQQPQANENYTDAVNFNQEALKTQNSDKTILPEKTWDGPLGQAVRDETEQGHPKPEAEPRTDTPDATPQPLGTPNEANPQTQDPTIVRNPAAEYDSEDDEQMDSAAMEENSVEHSEKGNLNDMKGYNEPKSRESEFYK